MCVTLQPTDSKGAPLKDLSLYVEKGASFSETFSRPLFRIRVKLNDDRVVVIVDNKRAVADFYTPVRLKAEAAACTFHSQTSTLEINAPIDWS